MNIFLRIQNLIFFISIIHLAHSTEKILPLQKDGCYYYDEHDTYKHIDLALIIQKFSKKLYSLDHWKKLTNIILNPKPAKIIDVKKTSQSHTNNSYF